MHGPGVDPHPVARIPVVPGNSDLCFEWADSIERAVAHLNEHGVQVEEGPVIRNGARGQGNSVYFRDPDGSLLEFISYASYRSSAVRRHLKGSGEAFSLQRDG